MRSCRSRLDSDSWKMGVVNHAGVLGGQLFLDTCAYIYIYMYISVSAPTCGSISGCRYRCSWRRRCNPNHLSFHA